MIHNQIIKLLNEKGIDFKLHEHAPTVTVQQALDNLPFPKEQFLKTVVFSLKSGGWVLAAATADARIDYRKLAEALQVSRSALVQPTPEEIEAALGFQLGGIGPFKLKDNVRVIFDEAALGMDWVFCGSGQNDLTLEIRLADLMKASEHLVASIIK